MFVSIDVLGVKEMILSFAQELLQYLVNPYKMFAEVCRVR